MNSWNKIWARLTDWDKSPIYFNLIKRPRLNRELAEAECISKATEARVSELISVLTEDGLQIRANAQKELIALGETALPILIEKGVKQTLTVRQSESIRDVLRVAGKPAVSLLIELLDEEDQPASWDVRFRAIKALGDIEDFSAIDALVKSVNDKDAFIGFCAVRALKRLGPRNYGDLKLLRAAAEKLRKNVSRDEDGFLESAQEKLKELYLSWIWLLKTRADNFVEEKKLLAPQGRRPDRVKRVQRLQRVNP